MTEREKTEGSNPQLAPQPQQAQQTTEVVVDDSGTPLSGVSLPTEAQRGPDFGLNRMCETIREAIAQAGVGMHRIAAIGVATPGTMDIPAGMILQAVNMPWVNVPVRRRTQRVAPKRRCDGRCGWHPAHRRGAGHFGSSQHASEHRLKLAPRPDRWRRRQHHAPYQGCARRLSRPKRPLSGNDHP